MINRVPINYGGGIAASTIAFLMPAADEVGALNRNDIDASGAAVLHHLSDAFFIGTENALPVLFFASALLSLRHGSLPKWLGRLSARSGSCS